MRLASSAFVVSCVAALTIGCGGSGDEVGVAVGTNAARDSSTPPATEAVAFGVLRRAKQEWQRTLDANAADDPAARFENLPEAEFRARLREAAGDYGFVVLEGRWLQPQQAAPLVVVEAVDPLSFAQDTPDILDLLDPQDPVGEDWEGWAFEGFFLEARDSEGVPFLAVHNHWRGSHRGGGQWARSEALYPFEHG